MTDNIKNAIAVAGILASVGALLTWKLGGSGYSVDDSAISEIQDDLSAFERMRADVAKDNPIKRDLIADIAASQDTKDQPLPNSEGEDQDGREGADKNQANCTDMDVIYGKKGCKKVTVEGATGDKPGSKNSKSNGKPGSNSQNNTSTSSNNGSSSSSSPGGRVSNQEKEEEPHPFLIWKEINQAKPDKLTGKTSIYPGDVIRAGCLVLAEIENEIIAIPGREHSVVLNVRGALDGCKLPKTSGIRLVGKAKLTNDERYIEARIETCSDRNRNRRSVSCKDKARVLSITGSELLEGWVYDESGMGILWESVVAIGMTPAVAKLTQTAATAKTIFTAQTAGEIAGTLTKTLDRISQKIAAAFDGREIRITPKPGKPVTVQVLFSKDVIL